MNDNEHPASSLMNFPSATKFIRGLLIGVFVLIGCLALFIANSLQPAQSAPKPAVADGPAFGYAMDAARAKPLAEENLIQTYTDWLQAEHGRVALDGHDAPRASQF
jgi:hypothetical protein